MLGSEVIVVGPLIWLAHVVIGEVDSQQKGENGKEVKTEEKSNEITAIPRLLKLLNIKGCLVTIDAIGCQKQITADIQDADADYLLAVKDNQPTLNAEVPAIFEHCRCEPNAFGVDFYETGPESVQIGQEHQAQHQTTSNERRLGSGLPHTSPDRLFRCRMMR